MTTLWHAMTALAQCYAGLDIWNIVLMAESVVVTWEELEKHIYSYDCWVLIEGGVYNVKDFLVEHPGGDDILVRFSGRDATEPFRNLPHSDYAVSLRNARLVGRIESADPPAGYLERIAAKKSAAKVDSKKEKSKVRAEPILMQEVSSHCSEESCWIVLSGKVYDATDYLEEHPGGVNKIMEWAGKDATKAFREANHSIDAINTSQKYYIGDVEKSSSGLLIVLALLLVLGGLFFLWK